MLVASPLILALALSKPRPVETPVVAPAPLTRPAPLPALYASFATLEALDYHSTTTALRSGRAREANPLMRPVVGNRAAFVAVKAASAGLTIWTAERLWKRNRVAAVVFMAAANGAMTAIVAHNYRAR